MKNDFILHRGVKMYKIISIICVTFFLILVVTGYCTASSDNQVFSITNDNNNVDNTINNDESTVELVTMDVTSSYGSKKPVIRYPNTSLPPEIREDVEYIEFQKDNSKKGQVFIFFNLPANTATVKQSQNIGNFILSRPEWIGDRTPESIAAEIYIHWVADNAEPLFQNNSFAQGLWEQLIIGASDDRPSPVHPTHLGYFYAGLDKTNAMDAFLLTL